MFGTIQGGGVQIDEYYSQGNQLSKIWKCTCRRSWFYTISIVVCSSWLVRRRRYINGLLNRLV